MAVGAQLGFPQLAGIEPCSPMSTARRLFRAPVDLKGRLRDAFVIMDVVVDMENQSKEVEAGWADAGGVQHGKPLSPPAVST